MSLIDVAATLTTDVMAYHLNDSAYNASVYSDSSEVEEMSAILRRFIDDLNETNYLLITLYVPVIVLAVTANILVIVVVFKYHYMRSVTNYFVVNLSVADLLVTMICMPMAVSQAVSITWVYGEIMCKLFFYLQGVAVAASVFTITAMSIDRYLAIRSPIAFRRVFNRRSTILVIAALWIVALSIFAPILKAVTLQSPMKDLDNITLGGDLTGDDEGVQVEKLAFYICSEDFKPLGIHAHIFGAACFVLVYAIPGFIVILAYSMMGRTLCARKPPFDCDSIEGSASSQQGFRLVRERRRVAWILLLLAVLFALCWLPYNVLRLLLDLGVLSEGRTISDVLSYCLFLGHANSALNPIVYCFMTRNFRRSVSEILCRSPHGLSRRKPHRKTLGAAAGVCGGCSGGPRVLGPIPGVPTPGEAHGVLALQRTATSSSGYDSFYSRHSPHRRCYMLKALPLAQQSPVQGTCPPGTGPTANGCAGPIRSHSSHSSHSIHSAASSSHSHSHVHGNGGFSKARWHFLQSHGSPVTISATPRQMNLAYTKVVYRSNQKSQPSTGQQPITNQPATTLVNSAQTTVTNYPRRIQVCQRVSFDDRSAKT